MAAGPAPVPDATPPPDAAARAVAPGAPGREREASVTPVATPEAIPAGAARPIGDGARPAPPVDPELAAGALPASTEPSPRAAVGRADMPPPATAADLARGVAVQVAEIVHRGGTQSVDVTLRPEELGRVRISMSSETGALAVTLQADRPETLDLIRRHIDLFAEELRRLGHASVGFSFQHGAPGGGGGAQSGPAPLPDGDAPAPATTAAEAAPDTATTPAPNRRAPGAGIDIRL